MKGGFTRLEIVPKKWWVVLLDTRSKTLLWKLPCPVLHSFQRSLLLAEWVSRIFHSLLYCLACSSMGMHVPAKNYWYTVLGSRACHAISECTEVGTCSGWNIYVSSVICLVLRVGGFMAWWSAVKLSTDWWSTEETAFLSVKAQHAKNRSLCHLCKFPSFCENAALEHILSSTEAYATVTLGWQWSLAAAHFYTLFCPFCSFS